MAAEAASSRADGPLSGYKIFDLTTNFSGPMATMLLADQGADVIKLETETGDQTRYSGTSRNGVNAMGSMFLNLNRNKRSIRLDLKTPKGLAAAQKIASQCDVVVQNFRAGVADRLGIGYETLKKLREDIICVSVVGLADSGPAAKRRVYDVVIQGVAGFAGSQAPLDTGEPKMIQNSITDKVAAFSVWQAVTAALLVRERTGKGQDVQVNMLKAGLAFLWPETMGSLSVIGEDVRHSATPASIRYIYPTKDNYLIVAFNSDSEWNGVCRAIERPELLEDPRFTTFFDRLGNSKPLNVIMSEAFRRHTTSEWLPILEREDVVFAPINTPETLLDDPLVRDVGAVVELQHPVVGATRLPAHPVQFKGTPATIDRRYSPLLGEHTEEVLKEFGIEDLR